MIRLLLAEDQAMMRGALASLLRLENDLDVVAEVGTAAAVLPAVTAHEPDIVVLDIEFPDGNGLDLTAAIRAAAPHARVVIVTTFGRTGYLRRALEAGASGFLVKDGPVDGLARALRTVAAGGTVVDPELAAAALSAGPSPLTARETDVLRAAETGAALADVAQQLFLSESTVRNYLSAAIGKTGTRNRMEAVRAARESGWL